VLFWTVAPVVLQGDAEPVGYLAQQRQVVGPREATYSLQQLIGEDVAMYLRNDSGSFWASAPGFPIAAPTRRDTSESDIFDEMPGGRMITAEAAIAGAPWLLVLQSPLSAAHGRAQRTLTTLAVLSLLLIVLGAAISWTISRRITHPIASLTTAAEAMARGDYTPRVEHRSGDEIGRLAVSFNQMADQVDTAHQELACQVEEAQASAEELEITNQQLQEAMTEAEQAREEADRANRAKGDFLAVMSHELRTPLNAIGGYAQLLELGVHGPVTETQRDALARIARSQGHLLRLINDVLNFAKIDAGQMQYEITDVAVDEVLAGLEAMVAPQVRAKRLRFTYVTCDQPLIARADREKLPQIVLNLVTNAIKFTPDGGEVIVECDLAGDRVRVRVRDTGVGIPAERLPVIFDPFVQVHRALHRPNEGVGLGLAISRDLARGMGGDLTVESAVEEGSVFTLTLPVGKIASEVGDDTPALGDELTADGRQR
ncbi:MAG: ATP-binding protein, partial [Gemmatimonadaceae bacterium]